MKKLIIAILAFAYLGASTGLVVTTHYCMGVLASWNLGNHHSATCGQCGMEKKNQGACCTDEHKFFKASPDQKLSEPAFYKAQLQVAALPSPFIAFSEPTPTFYTIENPTGHGPPWYHGVSNYILTCDYRI
jgi:hypothetical protein